MTKTYMLESVQQRSTVEHVSKMYGDLNVNRAMCVLAQQASLLLSILLKATGLGFVGSVAASLIGLSNLCASVRGGFAFLSAPTSIAGLIDSVMKGGEGKDVPTRALDIIGKLLITLSEVADVVALLAAQGLFSLGAASGLIPAIALGALALGAFAIAVKAFMESKAEVTANDSLVAVKQQREVNANTGKTIGAGLLALFGAATLAASYLTPVGAIMQGLAAVSITAYCVLRLLAHWKYDVPTQLPVESVNSKAVKISKIEQITADTIDQARYKQEPKTSLKVVAEFEDETAQIGNMKCVNPMLNTAVAVAKLWAPTVALSSSIGTIDSFDLPDAALNFVQKPQDPKAVCKLTKSVSGGLSALHKFDVVTVAKGTLTLLSRVALVAEWYLSVDELKTNLDSLNEEVVAKDTAEQVPQEVIALNKSVNKWKVAASAGRLLLAAAMTAALFFSSLAIGIVGCLAGVAMTVAKVTSTLIERTSEWRLEKLDNQSFVRAEELTGAIA